MSRISDALLRSGGYIALAREGLQVAPLDESVQSEADSASVSTEVPSERTEQAPGLQGISGEDVEVKRLTLDRVSDALLRSGGYIALARQELQVEPLDEPVQKEADSDSVFTEVPCKRTEQALEPQGASVEDVDVKRLTINRISDALVRFGEHVAPAEQEPQDGLVDKSLQSEADSVSVVVGVPSERAEQASGLQSVSIEEVDVERLNRVALITDPRGAAADRLRFLRMRLLEFQKQKSRRRLLVTSPLPQDGKSTTALNIASVLADAGRRPVLLVDADLHHSAVTEQLGFESRSGLAECLQAGLEPMSAVLRLEPLACYFLPAGKPDGNPTELLQSAEMPGVIAALSAEFDWIVIDSPPVAPFTDALSLKKEVDGTLLVVRAGQTPSASVEEAVTLLGREHLFGIVLNAVEGLDRLYSKYSKYYRHKT